VIDREILLRGLTEGDIFHAESPNGASLICLITNISETQIQARTVTSQLHLEFDRRTGVAEWAEDRVECTIDSIEPLPIDIFNLMLRIDRRYRIGSDPRLIEEEISALVYVDSHYSKNRLTI
jgi:hypothetical protein